MVTFFIYVPISDACPSLLGVARGYNIQTTSMSCPSSFVDQTFVDKYKIPHLQYLQHACSPDICN